VRKLLEFRNIASNSSGRGRIDQLFGLNLLQLVNITLTQQLRCHFPITVLLICTLH